MLDFIKSDLSQKPALSEVEVFEMTIFSRNDDSVSCSQT